MLVVYVGIRSRPSPAMKTLDGLNRPCLTRVSPNCQGIYPDDNIYFRSDRKNSNTCIACHKYGALIRSKRYAQRNPDKVREAYNNYDGRNKSRRRMSSVDSTIRRKELVLGHYGHKCVWPGCEIIESEFMAVDHINGGGRDHLYSIPSKDIYRYLIKNNFPEGFQLLCHNHNWEKFYNSADKSPKALRERKYGDIIKLDVFNHYGKSCLCCNESNLRVLSLDHIFGGGNELRRNKTHRKGMSFYRDLIKNNFPENIELRTLCLNCNFSRGRFGYCPHTVEKTGMFVSV